MALGAKRQGPFSSSRPIIELQPGPPFSQSANGLVLGLSLDSKSQKNMVLLSPIERQSVTNNCLTFDVCCLTNRECARVLMNTRSGFTDTRVFDVGQARLCSRVLEDRVINTTIAVAVTLIRSLDRNARQGRG